ncbi:MAG: bifunctional phosphoribosylaminoimidazolecarboxamide formyltransferase/IMP cyclohydrolase [Bacteroidetes bacterium]|nr:bifunctional phosphoribosylaminoimidazolecarboxamide formyltransferase/IMP cyclohydrolase [Bacteroidota bacterium]
MSASDTSLKNIRTALISVYRKDGLAPLCQALAQGGVQLYSTGGTAVFLREQGLLVTEIAEVSGYPSILGGRVKTLHPAVFGGILARQDLAQDQQDLAAHSLPTFDLVVADLYPFEETVAHTTDASAIIEKIDIGGVSLLRAAAKNHAHVAVVAGQEYYASFTALLKAQGCHTTLAQRHELARQAFATTARYEQAISDWFGHPHTQPMRYGENPHQAAHFVGSLEEVLDIYGGKALSYNNLLDVDAALRTLRDFEPGTFVIIKHTNPCGIATRDTVEAAETAARACDPVSAFGGILATNLKVTRAAAESMHPHFWEVLLAPEYEPAALELLQQKTNRRIIRYKHLNLPAEEQRTVLNGKLYQQPDTLATTADALEVATGAQPTATQVADMLFAERCAKHLKSNAIAIVKDRQLIGAGCGQTSRVDAMQQALDKVLRMGFSTQGAVLASDGFFPFSDGVELAHKAGVQIFLQPGGSMRDEQTLEYCRTHQLIMALTGTRHFRH